MARMNKFIEKRRFQLIYPSLVLLGIVVNVLFGYDEVQKEKDAHYLFSSRNAINQLFAYHGNDIWLVLFLSLSALQIYYRAIEWDPLPRDARIDIRSKVLPLMREYALKLLLKTVLLYVIFFVIDHVFVWTGGACSVSDTASAEQCRRDGGKWEGGFDISGHFCFLTNISMILWMEIYSFQHFTNTNEIQPSRKWISVIYLNIFVLITWAFVLSVTAIFYHTLMEKVIGVTMGYICPTVMYLLVPSIPALKKYMY